MKAQNDEKYHCCLQIFCNFAARKATVAGVLLRVRKVGTAQSDILPNGKPLETEEESATENNRPRG